MKVFICIVTITLITSSIVFSETTTSADVAVDDDDYDNMVRRELTQSPGPIPTDEPFPFEGQEEELVITRSKRCMESPFDAGFGNCSTYRPDHINFPYCSTDKDNSTNFFAYQVCPECRQCSGRNVTLVGSDPPLPLNHSSDDNESEIPLPLGYGYPEPHPYDDKEEDDETVRLVVCEHGPFQAGFGDCSTYMMDHPSGNFNFCSVDTDLKTNFTADQVCAECKLCTGNFTVPKPVESCFEEVTLTTPDTEYSIACKNDLVCQYGEEICCGVSHTTKECTCIDGFFDCELLNACSGVACGDCVNKTFDAGFGDCSHYAEGHPSGNYAYCSWDVDPEGVYADQACAECGRCDGELLPSSLITSCPSDMRMTSTRVFAECQGELSCEYGEQSCCDESYPQALCMCENNVFACDFVDCSLIECSN